MPTSIANLWTPAVWIDEIREKQATFPTLLNSGVTVRSPEFDGYASGAGTSVNMPFLKDITDQADEIQVENTGPVTDNVITGAVCVVPILNRVTKNSVGALSAQVSGADPVGATTDQILERRFKQRQTSLLAMVRGICGTAGAANAAAPLSAVRLGGTTAEPFDETGVGATAAQQMSPTLFIRAKALMGELADNLAAFWIHTDVLAMLEELDAANFKDGVPSGLPFAVRTYRGVPLFVSEALRRAGTGDGYVYDSYLFAKGIIAHGEKPQVGGAVNNPVIDVSSLNFTADTEKNNETIYDRTRFLMHVNGMKWTGTPAGQSATNAELQTVANWSLQFQTANRVGLVAIRTNG